MSFLRELRSKPNYVKTQLAFVGAFFVTIAIAAVWGMSIPAELAQMGVPPVAQEVSDMAVNADPSTQKEPGIFRRTLTNAGTSIRSQFATVFTSLTTEAESPSDEVSTDNEEEMSSTVEPPAESAQGETASLETSATSTMQTDDQSEAQVEAQEEPAEPAGVEEEATSTEPHASTSTPPRKQILIGTTTIQKGTRLE